MTVEIPLTKGYTALVDDADAGLVLGVKWRAIVTDRSVYAGRAVRSTAGTRRQSIQYMHTLITGWAITDHRDGNGLNNQRANLRQATLTQNNRNRRANRSASRFKGVAINRGRGMPWKAAIGFDGISRHLGYFADESDAARAYDKAARELFGEFAAVNFPQPGERCALRDAA